MNLKIKLLYFLVLVTSVNYGQTIIKGTVSDINKEFLVNTTIIALDINDDTILSYTASNENGEFLLKIRKNVDSIKIKASYIGFKPQLKKIKNVNSSIHFILKEETEKLEEVFIKNNPIIQRNDTLSYSVNSFKTKKDQVIADVLRKMPGIEVLLDGKILYQGKPIQKYYIEGLDLLEGRYNLANNNLPVDAVSKIQILENHQPIRILDSVIFSDKASLNIKLKNKKTFVGSAKLGIGYSPLLWDANVTPMLFTKNKQLIASYQSNNIGKNVANELKMLTTRSFLENLENKLKAINWVRISPITSPPFTQERWLNNSIHLASLNYLEKVKNNYQVKGNLSYFNDYQNQIANIKTSIYTPSDTISLIENKKNNLFFSELRSELIVEKNTRNLYFKNSTKFNASWNSQDGQINNNQLTQDVDNPTKRINNSLKWIFPFKKNLITINSDIYYRNNHQSLLLNKGLFKDVLNDGNLYRNLTQKVNQKIFFTDNSFSFIKSYSRFTLSLKNGFTYENNNLNSFIFIDENKLIKNDFLNDISLNKSILYSIPFIQFENVFAKVKIALPLSLVNINLDNEIDLRKIQELNFEPKITLLKDINAFWQARASIESKKNYGNIEELYAGYIVKDYRNINAYNSPISTRKQLKQNVSLSYKNPLNGIFIGGFYSHIKSNENLIYNYSYTKEGALTINAIEKKNTRINQNFNIRVSKYFSDLETTLVFSGAILRTKKEQFINNTLSNITSNQKQLKTELDVDFFDWLNFNGKNNISFVNSTNAKNSLQELKNMKTSLELNIYPEEKQVLSVLIENYSNTFKETNTNTFLNLKYRYTFSKKKINLELNWLNILNTKEYQTNFVSNFNVIQTNFNIRPSQITASLKFRF